MQTFYSWNVNGVRAAQKKGFLGWLQETQPDILGIQETKAQPDQLDEVLRNPEGYYAYWASAERKGYSGVALFCKREPLSVQFGLGIDEFDCEGRTLVAEFPEFTFITAYFPNGSRDHVRVPYKMRYKRAFHAFCNELRSEGKRVIFCGDVNTCHQPIDIARPKQNEKNTGFLPKERAWLDEIFADGYVDSFRHLHPEQTGAYSWWSYMKGVRERNVGWRLDYFINSADIVPFYESAEIHADVMGSDHCPVSLTLNL